MTMQKILYLLVCIMLLGSVTAVWDNNDVVLYWEIGNGGNLTEAKDGVWNGANDKGSVSPTDNYLLEANSALLLDISAGQGSNQINFSDITPLERFTLGRGNSYAGHTVCSRVNITPSATAEYMIQNQAGGNFHDLKMTITGGKAGMQYTVGAASATLTGTSQIRNNTWLTICVTGDNATNNGTLYVNCENQDSASNYEGFGNGTGSLLLWNPGGVAGIEVDDLVFFNKTLTETELCTYTAGTQEILINETIVINPFLRDRLGNNLTIIEEDEEFYVTANVTRDGSVLTSAECNFTASNITAHLVSESPSNVTFNSLISTHTLIASESTTALRFDVVEFEVCRVNALVDLEILFNGTLHRTIDGGIIPLCDIGRHEEINITKERIAVGSTNVTVSCPGCNSGTKQIILVSDSDNDLLHFERVYGSSHVKDMAYNATSELFEFREHAHEYSSSGINLSNINVTCNSTQAQIKQDVVNVNLTIDILQINDVSYVDGLQVERVNLTNISIDVSGDIIQNITFNVTYENGTLVSSINTEVQQLDNTALDVDGIYNISIFAIDNDNQGVTQTGFFRYNDTLPPTITWSNPLEDNSTSHIIDTNFQLQLIFNDNTLDDYEIEIESPAGITFVNYSASNVNVAEVTIFEVFLPNLTGVWFVNVTVNDTMNNQLKQMVEFSVVTTPPVNATLAFNECPDTLEGNFALWTVAFIILFFIFIGFMFRIMFVGILAAMGIIILAFTISGCSQLIGLVLGAIGAAVAFAFVLRPS